MRAPSPGDGQANGAAPQLPPSSTGGAGGANPTPQMELLSALAAAIDEPIEGLSSPPGAQRPQPGPGSTAAGTGTPPAHAPTATGGPHPNAGQGSDWLPTEQGPTRWRPSAGSPPPVPSLADLGVWSGRDHPQTTGSTPAADEPNSARPEGPPPVSPPAAPATAAVPSPLVQRQPHRNDAPASASQVPTGPSPSAAPPVVQLQPGARNPLPSAPAPPGPNTAAVVRQLPPPPPAARATPPPPSGAGRAAAPPPPPFRTQGPSSAPPPAFRGQTGDAAPTPTPTATDRLVTPDTDSLTNYLHEPEREPDPDQDLKARAQTSLLEGLGARLYDPSLTEDAMNDLVANHLEGFFASESITLTAEERLRIASEITDDLLRHGPIEPFLADPAVNEIMVNGPKMIYIERKGKLVLTKVQFRDEAQLRRVIERIVGRIGRRIDESSPMVDARLPDGSRVNAIIPPLAVDGPTLTIRKFTADGFTINDLVRTRSLTAEVAGLLEVCVRGRLNILVSGGTGSGKTTLLNILSSFIPLDERIVTIEDAVELRLRQPHVIRLESRPANVEGKGAVTIRDLVRNSLRMRPDRVVIGECRGGETLDMLQAMNTGHDGSLSTLHANTPRDALSRIETMVLMAGMDLPVRAIREQVASAVDLIVQIARLRDGSRRVTHISEVAGMEGDTITMNDVFALKEYGETDEFGLFTGVLKPSGIRPLFADRLADHGIHVPVELFGETYGLRLGNKPKASGGW